MKLKEAVGFILQKMELELPQHLYYHSIAHVNDVMQSARMLAELEKITPYEKDLLFTAVAFHDCGFIYSTLNHEVKGCEVAREHLGRFDYTSEEIDRICAMILSTRIPQNPLNHLEQIICDADLDYLGRADFWEIGNRLFQELTQLGMLHSESEWNLLQKKFLSSHTYFTESAKRLREEAKALHLDQIIKTLNA